MAGPSVIGRLRVAQRRARWALGHGRLAAAVRSTRPAVDERTVAPADVALRPLGPEEREVLARLVQLYRHDLAEHRPYVLGDDGTYPDPYRDVDLAEAGREAYLVRAEGRLAGFAMARELPDGTWQAAELFVARSFRRRGVARVALERVVRLHPGRWTCFVDRTNETSLRMSADVAAAVGGRPPELRAVVSANGFPGTAVRFEVPPEGAGA